MATEGGSVGLCSYCKKPVIPKGKEEDERIGAGRCCSFAIYCSKKCQTDDWPKHKNVCARPKRISEFATLNLEKETKENTYYRKVIYTGQFQVVLMSLKPHEEIGLEKHVNDQFFRVELGSAVVESCDKTISLTDGWSAVVPGGTYHNVIAGDDGAKLYTIYSPPAHAPDTLQKEKPKND